MKRLMAVLSISAALLSTGCAPDRAQWMAQAASTQAQVATQDIGSVEQVKQAPKSRPPKQITKPTLTAQ